MGLDLRPLPGVDMFFACSAWLKRSLQYSYLVRFDEAHPLLSSSSCRHVTQAWPIRALLPHSHSDWLRDEHMTHVKPMRVISGTFHKAMMT